MSDRRNYVGEHHIGDLLYAGLRDMGATEQYARRASDDWLTAFAALLAERDAARQREQRLREALQRIADENYLRGENDGWEGMCARQGRLARAALVAEPEPGTLTEGEDVRSSLGSGISATERESATTRQEPPQRAPAPSVSVPGVAEPEQAQTKKGAQ